MTAFLAGLVFLRADDDDWPLEMDVQATAVLAAMASYASENDPMCWAGPKAIAKRARVSVDTVRDRTVLLDRLGFLRYVEGGGKTGKPTRWRLLRLRREGGETGKGVGPEGVGHQPIPQTEDGPPAQGGYATSPPGVGPQPNNPSDLSRCEAEREREEDRESADAGVGAGAPPSAADPSMATASDDRESESGPGGVVGMVMTRLGLGQQGAEDYIARKRSAYEAKHGRPVVRLFAFITTCVDNDLAERTSTSSTSSTTSVSAGGSAKKSKSGKAPKGAAGQSRPGVARRQRMTVEERNEEKCWAIYRVRRGDDSAEVAEELGMAPGTVDQWARYATSDADLRWRQDVVDALRSGVAPAEVGQRFNRSEEWVNRLAREWDGKRPEILARAAKQQPVEFIAMRLAVSVAEVERVLAGQTVTVDRPTDAEVQAVATAQATDVSTPAPRPEVTTEQRYEAAVLVLAGAKSPEDFVEDLGVPVAEIKEWSVVLGAARDRVAERAKWGESVVSLEAVFLEAAGSVVPAEDVSDEVELILCPERDESGEVASVASEPAGGDVSVTDLPSAAEPRTPIGSRNLTAAEVAEVEASLAAGVSDEELMARWDRALPTVRTWRRKWRKAVAGPMAVAGS